MVQNEVLYTGLIEIHELDALEIGAPNYFAATHKNTRILKMDITQRFALDK